MIHNSNLGYFHPPQNKKPEIINRKSRENLNLLPSLPLLKYFDFESIHNNMTWVNILLRLGISFQFFSFQSRCAKHFCSDPIVYLGVAKILSRSYFLVAVLISQVSIVITILFTWNSDYFFSKKRLFRPKFSKVLLDCFSYRL